MKLVAFLLGFGIGYLLTVGIFFTVVPFPPVLVGVVFGAILAAAA